MNYVYDAKLAFGQQMTSIRRCCAQRPPARPPGSDESHAGQRVCVCRVRTYLPPPPDDRRADVGSPSAASVVTRGLAARAAGLGPRATGDSHGRHRRPQRQRLERTWAASPVPVSLPAAWVAPDGPLGPIYMAQLRKGEFRWMPLFPRASSAKSKDPPAPIAARVHTHTQPARAHGRRVPPLASSVATMVVCALCIDSPAQNRARASARACAPCPPCLVP